MKNAILLLVLTLLCAACQGEAYSPDAADVGEVAQAAANSCNPIGGVRRLTNLVTQFYWLASEGYATGHGHGSPNEYFSASREPIVVNLNPGAAPPCRADGVCSCHWTNNPPVEQHGACYAIVRYYCSYTPPIGRTEWRSYAIGLTGDHSFPNWTGPVQADLYVHVDDSVPLSDNPSVIEELLGRFSLTTPGR